jgi:DNA adenine methylase
VRDRPEELIARLEFVLNAREDFHRARAALRSQAPQPDMVRAAYFYQVICQSYASKLTAFSAQPQSMWNTFPFIRAAAGRLQGVIIENNDFEKIVRLYDRQDTLFYLDPPYLFSERNYERRGFVRADHERLAHVVLNMRGRFLLSYNDCSEARQLYGRPGITIETVSRLNHFAQRFEGGKQFDEVLIANYDTGERARQHEQLSLF